MEHCHRSISNSGRRSTVPRKKRCCRLPSHRASSTSFEGVAFQQEAFVGTCGTNGGPFLYACPAMHVYRVPTCCTRKPPVYEILNSFEVSLRTKRLGKPRMHSLSFTRTRCIGLQCPVVLSVVTDLFSCLDESKRPRMKHFEACDNADHSPPSQLFPC